MKTLSRDAVIQRVEKLFALADADRNPSEHEVYAALTAAKKLMAEYDLSESDIAKAGGATKTPWTFTSAVGVEGRTQLFGWELTLASAVEKLTGTQSVIRRKTARKGRSTQVVGVTITYYGAEVDVALACALYACLRKTARGMAEDAWAGWSDRRCYLEGFTRSIYDRSVKPAEVPAEDRNRYALVSTEKKDWLAAQVKTALPTLRTSNRTSTPILNAAAYREGLRDGRTADLDPQGKLAQS